MLLFPTGQIIFTIEFPKAQALGAGGGFSEVLPQLLLKGYLLLSATTTSTRKELELKISVLASLKNTCSYSYLQPSYFLYNLLLSV